MFQPGYRGGGYCPGDNPLRQVQLRSQLIEGAFYAGMHVPPAIIMSNLLRT